MKTKLYQEMAQLVDARLRCIATKSEWADNHEHRLLQMCKDFMPSGSGFDSGTKLDLDKSTGEKLVFHTSFHHMNDCGMYDGWTDHTVIVTASLAFGFVMRITGRNRNGIKDYMHDVFHTSLETNT